MRPHEREDLPNDLARRLAVGHQIERVRSRLVVDERVSREFQGLDAPGQTQNAPNISCSSIFLNGYHMEIRGSERDDRSGSLTPPPRVGRPPTSPCSRARKVSNPYLMSAAARYIP